MTYVLIIILVNSSLAIKFDNKESCEYAGQQAFEVAHKQAPGWVNQDQMLRWTCVPVRKDF